MKLVPRDYQLRAVEGAEQALKEVDEAMGVACTGAGKTIMASLQMQRQPGNCLFLADAQELVHQNADKYFQVTGERAGVEMGAQSAVVGKDRVVVATAQSLARRLSRYPEDYFNLIIADECHRNTLGEQTMSVLEHFEYAKKLGVTATPFRQGKAQLGDYYKRIAFEIGLPELIPQYLSRITIKSVPMKVDMTQVSSTRGDYKLDDLGEVIEPILKEAAKQLIEHCGDRKKIVIFLPLIKTSIRMTRILNEMGMKAVHCSGEDKSEIEKFTKGDAQFICNAQLLTTGWDCPQVDCVLVLRPTKSLALYSQMVGRGTRIYCPHGCHEACDHVERKKNLLVLDPLFLTDDHRLINPARLICRTEEEAQSMMAKLEDGTVGDLMEMEEDIEEQRAEAIRTRMKQKEKKKARTVDAMEFAMHCNDKSTAEFIPQMGWEKNAPSAKQREVLERAGFDMDEITTQGQAAKVIDLLFTRRKNGLATPKQLRMLKRFGHPDAAKATFAEASNWLDNKFAGFKQNRRSDPPGKPTGGHLPTAMLVKLKRAGINPAKVKTVFDAEVALKTLEVGKTS